MPLERSSRGVKQGCPASPLLYAAFMSLITRRLDCKLGRHWVADHLTAFADDLHVSCLIRSYVDLDRFCQCLGVVLHTLRQHGMVVNVQKVAVILALNGTSRRQALRVFTKKIKDHRYLRISCSGESLLLPIHRQAPYLGVVTSYLNSAELSLQLRLQKCKAAQARLRGVLQGRRGLSLGQRILLWKTTVLPCAMYGLGACGLTGIQLVRLRQVLLKQLRAISKAPAHITHESDAALLSRLGVLAPQQALARQHARTLRCLDSADAFVMQQDHPWMLYLETCWSAHPQDADDHVRKEQPSVSLTDAVTLLGPQIRAMCVERRSSHSMQPSCLRVSERASTLTYRHTHGDASFTSLPFLSCPTGPSCGERHHDYTRRSCSQNPFGAHTVRDATRISLH